MVDELFKPADPPEGAALNNTTETPSPSLLDSILPRLPPEGQAWLNGLNSFADARSSMICATLVRTYSLSIGSHFATPSRNSNATSAHPIIGSSWECPPLPAALVCRTPNCDYTTSVIVIADRNQKRDQARGITNVAKL
jgi:hypothetical protein